MKATNRYRRASATASRREHLRVAVDRQATFGGRPRRAVMAVSLAFAGAAMPAAGCSSGFSTPETSPNLDAGRLDAGRVDAGDGGAGAENDGGFCRTPSDDDLEPHVNFSDDDAIPVSTPSCGDRGGPDGGGPSRTDGGEPSTPDGGAPNNGGSNGAPGATPGNGPGDLDGGAAPRAIIDEFPNEFGRVAQQQLAGQLGIFAEASFAKNGRFCESCHANQNDWSLTPAFVQARFYQGQQSFTGNCTPLPNNEAANQNDELESIFRTVDGTNSPLDDVSTPAAREKAYSLLLKRAVIRIGQAVPADADFELASVDDPYGFASAAELSLFRRSPSMANLRFNTTIMWDGREQLECSSLKSILRKQATHAVTSHAQGNEPSEEAVTNIVETELKLYLAQLIHNSAGQLNEGGARGGPVFLAQVPFYAGINAFEKNDPYGQPYSREVFSLYASWRALPGDADRNKARALIAEGERLFDAREFTIHGVSGFNDVLGRAEVTGTCGACHNTPNVGTNSEGRLMDIGVSDEAQRSADLPLYTFRQAATGAILKTSDPGQALVTKQWSHMNRFKVPTLRGLASRPPYLHNGGAASLEAVVNYHDQRFTMHLTAEEKAALVAFLSAL